MFSIKNGGEGVIEMESEGQKVRQMGGGREHSLDIDIGSSLVQNQDLVFPEESSGQADQLPLAYAEVGPTLGHNSLQPSLQLFHSTLQLYLQLPGETGIFAGASLMKQPSPLLTLATPYPSHSLP